MAINFSYISDEITEVLSQSNELAIESPEVRCSPKCGSIKIKITGSSRWACPTICFQHYNSRTHFNQTYST